MDVQKINSLFGWRGSKIEEGSVKLNYFVWMFFKEGGEGFGGVITISNPSFLILQIGEIWKESRV